MFDNQYMKNIVDLNFSNYRFELFYAEILTEQLPEFPHSHNMYEIYYVLDNEITITINGKIHRVTKGHAVFIDKNVHHFVFYEPAVAKRYFAVIFDVYSHDPIGSNGPDGINEWRDIQRVLHVIETEGCYDLHIGVNVKAEQIFEEIQNKKLGWNSRAVMLSYSFFIDVLRLIDDQPVRDREFAGYPNLAMDVSKYIHAFYPEDISVESVAEYLCVSPRHINRAYKSAFNITFMKNVNLLRIAYAKEYLCKTNHSVEKISELVGFQSARVFYKLFERYEGMTAIEYRKKYRNIEN